MWGKPFRKTSQNLPFPSSTYLLSILEKDRRSERGRKEITRHGIRIEISEEKRRDEIGIC